jgi:hypothetical protein
MKLGMLILAVALLAAAYFGWEIEPEFSKIGAAIGVVLGFMSFYPVGRARSIACCSASLTEALLDVGVSEDQLTCPIEGKLNYKFLMASLKSYKFVIFDANPTKSGEMALNDIKRAAHAQYQGATVLVRFDRSSYVASGMVDRAEGVEMLLKSNKLKFVSTSELQKIVTTYYGKKG